MELLNKIDDGVIFLGELKHKGEIPKKEYLTIEETNVAAIFSKNFGVDLNNFEVILKDINTNKHIIETKFIEVPKNKYFTQQGEEISYIAEKAINKNTLGNNLGLFSVFIPQINYSFNIYIDNKFANIDTHMDNTISDTMESIEKEIQMGKDELRTIEIETMGIEAIERESIGTEFSTIESPECESYDISDNVNTYCTAEEEINNVEEVNNAVNEENIISDKIKYITLAFMEAASVKINLNDFIVENPTLDSNIIIEKIKDRYYATICGIGFKPFKMLDGDNNYFTFEEGPMAFLDKIKNRLQTMYSMSQEDVQALKVTLIIDSEVEVIGEESGQHEESLGFTIYTREDFIKLINKKGINTITISKKNINISYINEYSRKIDLTAELSGLLGAKEFVDNLLVKLNEDILVFDETSEEINYICLTDILL